MNVGELLDVLNRHTRDCFVVVSLDNIPQGCDFIVQRVAPGYCVLVGNDGACDFFDTLEDANKSNGGDVHPAVFLDIE